jgi:HAD superfamily hydrolase (TIGR01549 family)
VTRAVLFDLDDTLFDHRGSARAALGEVHRVHAPDADFAAFERHHAHYLEEMHLEVLAGRIGLDDARRERFRRVFAALGLPLAGAHLDAVAAAYRRGYMSARRVVEGAADLLAAVRPHARIAVVTNNLLDEQREKLAFCGLTPLVDELVVSEDVGVSKPDPVIFHLALARLDAEAGQAVMVGDSWAADIVGAAAAGIRPVWFNPGRTRRPLHPPDVAEIHALVPADDLLPVLLDSAGQE